MTAIVDIELELITRGTARFPDAVVRDEVDNDLGEELPTIQITQIPGGGDDGIRLARMIVDIDVYAADRAAAITLMRDVHAWVTGELRGSSTADLVIGRTGCLSLPAIRPYTNTALRRAGGTYEIFCHPVS
ncbi:phage tail termination protein [Streptomyces sp. NPDC001858]